METLTTYLGENVAGDKLKETGITHWNSSISEATNETGFSAVPGGYRIKNGAFLTIGNFGNWWSSTDNLSTDAWYRLMIYDLSEVNRGFLNKSIGLSVRCLEVN